MRTSAAREEEVERGGRGEARRDAARNQWAETRVGDLCRLVNGSAFKPSDWSMEGAPIIRIQNLNDADKPYNYWAGDVDDCVRVRRGDILLAWSGTPGTSFGAHIWDGEDGVLNQHIFRVDLTSDEVTPAWFVWAVNFRLENLIGRAHGAVGLAHVTKGEVQALEIPFPPLAEQERIAGLLTEQLGAVERARAAAAHRLAAAESLPAALLREVFDGAEWPIAKLGAGVMDLEAGTSVVAAGRPAEADEWGVLKVSAVSWGEFRAHENKAVPPGYVPGEHERVKPGDFLISRANTAELAGAVVLVRETPGNLMLSDKTLRVVINRNVFVPEYLEFALRTRAARKFIEGNATGTSYSMRNISQPTILAIPVPTPDLPTQRRLAADLGERLAAAEGVIARCREELAAIEALPAALLRDAFGQQSS